MIRLIITRLDCDQWPDTIYDDDLRVLQGQ